MFLSGFEFLAAAGLLVATAAAKTCNGSATNQPNPIASTYPDDATGTVNGTISILPIPYALARTAIPKQYGILTDSYMALIPGFPAGMYPALLQAELDHDVRDGSITLSDFSRVSIAFPFVDRLDDGYTAMTYGLHLLLSSTEPVAALGAGLYGYDITLATFEPPCQAYGFEPGSKHKETFLDAYVSKELKTSATLAISTRFTPLATGQQSLYSIDVFKNITNQPQFGSTPEICDNFIRFFNASVTIGEYAPVPVVGNVTAVQPYFPVDTTFSDVHGLKLDNAFLEHNYVACESLRRYSGTGSGD